MFGDLVFEAVLAAGASESGASVHLVDAEYDTGAVVRQERVHVFPEDTVESLKARCKRASAKQSSGRWLLLRVASWFSEGQSDKRRLVMAAALDPARMSRRLLYL